MDEGDGLFHILKLGLETADNFALSKSNLISISYVYAS